MFRAFGSGRFTRDPESRQVGDTKVCEFSLAVDERRKVNGENKKFVSYFDFEIWDKAADVICQYCQKGDLLEVVCTPRQHKWESDGIKRSRVIYRVDSFNLMPRSNRQSDASGGANSGDSPNGDGEKPTEF